MQKFIEISQRKIDGTLTPKRRKMFLYSGHENNIVNILAVLGLYKQHIPPYCSAVMLELHKDYLTDHYGFKVRKIEETTLHNNWFLYRCFMTMTHILNVISS